MLFSVTFSRYTMKKRGFIIQVETRKSLKYGWRFFGRHVIRYWKKWHLPRTFLQAKKKDKQWLLQFLVQFFNFLSELSGCAYLTELVAFFCSSLYLLACFDRDNFMKYTICPKCFIWDDMHDLKWPSRPKGCKTLLTKAIIQLESCIWKTVTF